jgi:hypothetical protein
VGKRLSGYAVFALFFLIVVKAVRFFVRQPGGGMDCFFLAAFAAFGIFGVAVLVEGGANPARRVRGGFYLFRFCWFLSQASFC